MLEKILEEIKAAELEAEATIRQAEDAAKAIVSGLAVKLEAKKAAFLENQRAEHDCTLDGAAKKAEAAFCDAIKAAEKKATELEKAADKKLSQAVEFIKNKIVE